MVERRHHPTWGPPTSSHWIARQVSQVVSAYSGDTCHCSLALLKVSKFSSLIWLLPATKQSRVTRPAFRAIQRVRIMNFVKLQDVLALPVFHPNGCTFCFSGTDEMTRFGHVLVDAQDILGHWRGFPPQKTRFWLRFAVWSFRLSSWYSWIMLNLFCTNNLDWSGLKSLVQKLGFNARLFSHLTRYLLVPPGLGWRSGAKLNLVTKFFVMRRWNEAPLAQTDRGPHGRKLMRSKRTSAAACKTLTYDSFYRYLQFVFGVIVIL